MKIDQVALQLYTLRDHLKTPDAIAESLHKVAAIGYQAVQISGMGPIPEADVVALLDAEGLTLVATHEPADTILKDPAAVIERLGKLRCSLTAYPYPNGVNCAEPAEVEALAKELNRVAKIYHEAGITLSYHNHGIELMRQGDGTVLDYLYAATDPRYLQAEIDTYWIQYGGGSPAAWCRKLAGRLPALHIKDYRFTAKNLPDVAEIGSGNLNWPEIIAAAEESGCRWFIVEQDTCPGDPFESIKLSFDYIKANLCQAG